MANRDKGKKSTSHKPTLNTTPKHNSCNYTARVHYKYIITLSTTLSKYNIISILGTPLWNTCIIILVLH